MSPVESDPRTRILLVEDEAIIALDLKQRLESLGYEVTGIAASGDQALALAESTGPTLIFMDITIQGPIDGIETAKILSGRADIPVVFLTAHADAGTIDRARAARPYGYLVKPFDERELATTIEMAVYRHRSEAEARLLQQAIANASVGIVVATTRMPLLPITLCNAAFERMTGYPASEVLGRSPSFIEGVDTDPEASAEVRAAIQAQRDARVTLRVHRKGGRAFWVDLALSAVRNPVGEVTHFVFFFTEATARKEAELALVQAQKVEAIGQLAGGVAHDFNNILAVITGYCEMAQRQIGAEHAARPRLDQILKAANRAADLTRQLLAFSRKQILQPRPLDLNVITADAQNMLGRLIGENIEMVIRPGAFLGTVNADPGQIEQVIFNLAVNARDAMPKGGTLTLETQNVDLDEAYASLHPRVTPGRYVMLAVSDTGVGMTPQVQSRAFDPFFTTKAEGQGTGLGLATVHGIVQQSGGHIWVYSEPGRGTTFKIYLPRVDRPGPEAGPARSAGAAPRGSETILLAEDTETLRDVIRESLHEHGYVVLPASDGAEALALARAYLGPIHLLLTDVVMPKMGGADLAAALSETRPSLPVLFMSGYTDGALSQHGVLGEDILLLEKPFSNERLLQMVRTALERKARRPPA